MLSRKRETRECVSHQVATKALRELILKTIQTVSRYALSNEVEFARKVREASELQQAQAAKETKARIRKAQKRCKELDVLIQKLYESYALEKISEKRFDDFLAGYEKEQAELKAVLETDTEELRAYEVDSDHIASFLKLARKYREADELTTPMIYAFVEKIIVHAPEKIDGERHMQIDIYLKFIGNFQVPQDEPTAEEMAEEEKLLMRLKNGKRNAIDEAIAVYTPYLSTVLYNMLGNRLPKEDIEEILSDVFVTLWRNADTIDLEKGTLRAYLAAVARNFALKKLNKQRDYTSLDEIELPDEAPIPEENTAESVVWDAVMSLGEPDNEIFVRYYIFGEKIREIAKATGLNPSTVKTKLSRGKRKLKEILLHAEGLL